MDIRRDVMGPTVILFSSAFIRQFMCISPFYPVLTFPFSSSVLFSLRILVHMKC